MTAQILDFTVSDLNREIKSGSCDKLYQKNNEGFLVSAEDSVTLDLSLKMVSSVERIEIKIINVNKLQIQLLSETNQVNQRQQKLTQESQKTYLFDYSFPKKWTKCIRITLGNISSNGMFGIKYIILKGERFNHKMASNNKQKKEEFFEQPRKSPHAILSKVTNDVFGGRVKHKQKEKQVKGVENQDDQLKRVLQMSRKQAEKHESAKKSVINNKKEQYMVIEEDTIVLVPQTVRDYAKVEYDSCKQIFSFVNTRWLQAQKKAELQLRVKEGQRLSLKIKIKHLYNKLIMIDISNSQKKQHLQRLALGMGAKLISELKEHSILVTNRTDTQRVDKARKIGKISIVNPQFIEECHQCDALLNIKDYFLKL